MPTIDPYPPIPGLPPLPYSPLSLPTNNIATAPLGTAQAGMGSTPPPLPDAGRGYTDYRSYVPAPPTGLGASVNTAYSASERNRVRQLTYNTNNMPGSTGMTYNANNLPSYNHNPASNEAQQGVQQYQNSERGGPAPQTQYQQSERTRTPTQPGQAVITGTNALGQQSAYYVPPGASINVPAGTTEADYMTSLGYVRTTNGGWTLTPTSNGAASTAGRSWYGTDAKLAGGARGGGVYLSSFATQQAYETWARSKRLEAKKAAEQEKKPNAANYVQYTAGTG